MRCETVPAMGEPSMSKTSCAASVPREVSAVESSSGLEYLGPCCREAPSQGLGVRGQVAASRPVLLAPAPLGMCRSPMELVGSPSGARVSGILPLGGLSGSTIGVRVRVARAGDGRVPGRLRFFSDVAHVCSVVDSSGGRGRRPLCECCSSGVAAGWCGGCERSSVGWVDGPVTYTVTGVVFAG